MKQRQQKTVPILTPEFLKRKALTRDKANYVMAIVRMRQEVRHLMNTATDIDVTQELLCLDEFFEDSVTTMYTIDQQPTQPKPKGAA